jgi:hypothetical protein
MQRVEFLNALEFQQKLACDHEVYPISTVQVCAFVNQGEWHLAFMLDAHRNQFQMKSMFIIRFIQSWPKLSMYSYGCRNDLPCKMRSEVFM